MHPTYLLLAAVSWIQFALAQKTTASDGTYTNPILDSVGADPWVTRYEGYYYLMFTNGANITLYRSQGLT